MKHIEHQKQKAESQEMQMFEMASFLQIANFQIKVENLNVEQKTHLFQKDHQRKSQLPKCQRIKKWIQVSQMVIEKKTRQHLTREWHRR
jgi:hypothetical protein